MVRILYLIGTLDVGGAERQLAELATRLDRARFEPVVCALTAGGPVQEDIEKSGVPVRILGLRGVYSNRSLLSAVRVPAALFRLYRFIRAGRFDIVHGFLFHACVLAAFLGRAARVPRVVASRRGLDVEIYGRRLNRRAARAAGRRTDLVIANSAAGKAEAVKRDGVPPAKVLVIPNGIDTSLYANPPAPGRLRELRRELGLKEASPVVGMVANLNRYKDHAGFLEAAAMIAVRRPEARFLLVGEGPTRTALEARSRRPDLDGRVVLAGGRRDVPALLAMIDVFVLCSHEEGLPNAILEAMAAAKPVVATRVGGVPEVVEDGRTGLLVPPSEPAALAEAILRLLDDPGTAAAMGRAGRRRADQVFGMEAMVRSTEAAYEALGLPARP